MNFVLTSSIYSSMVGLMMTAVSMDPILLLGSNLAVGSRDETGIKVLMFWLVSLKPEASSIDIIITEVKY